MSEQPKLIFKYTHAQAVANGDLKLIPSKIPVPLYISIEAQKKFANESEESISQAVAYALLMDSIPKSWVGRTKAMHNGIEYEIDRGFEIRDDDKRVACVTVIAPGER
ncbi:MAG TPA: hypothetical protein V6C76_11515 [Drouetiella sp.]